jgi:hypothetical protein
MKEIPQIEEIIDELISQVENLPPIAMTSSLNHYDYLRLLYLLKAIYQNRCKDEGV